MDRTDRATAYANQVAEGRIVSGKPHIQACTRHLNDLSRQGTQDFPYLWVKEKSQRIIEFSETLTIAEGVEPLPLTLYGCQDFDLGVPMGWVHRETGNRRFRRKYKSVARQNGKTLENGVMAAYIAAFSGYHHGKIFTAANKKRQARIAWEETQKFIGADRDLGELFRVQDWKSLITAIDTGCTIEALSKEAGIDDGFRAIFASVDELHQARDGSVYNAIYRGTRSLPETLVSAITTRGKLLNGFCRELDDYCLKILAGAATAEDFFADIYTHDEEDDHFSSEVWLKSNPVLMQRPGGYEVMGRDAQTAKDMGGEALADYLTKCCNVWAFDPSRQYIDPADWARGGCELTLSDMRGKKCWAGIDLSSGGDLASIVLVFQLDAGLYAWSHSFMPMGRLQEHIMSDLAPYGLWADRGLLTVTGGGDEYKNDYKFIVKKLREEIAEHDLKLQGIGYDPHNADAFLSDLEEFGVPLLMVKQSARELDMASQHVQLEIKSGRVLYDAGNDLLSWSMANAKTVYNSFGEMKIDKDKRSSRIDPVDALMDAVTMMLKCDGEPVDTAQVAEDYMKMMGWG